MERVVVFVDGSNVYYRLKEDIGYTKVDFCKLSRILAGRRKFIRVYYYTAAFKQGDNPGQYAAQQRFFSALEKSNYITLKKGRLEKRTIKIDKDNLVERFGQDITRKIVEELGEYITTFVEKGVDIRLAIDMRGLVSSVSRSSLICVN